MSAVAVDVVNDADEDVALVEAFDRVAGALLHPEGRSTLSRDLDVAWFAGLVSAALHGPDAELRAAVLEAVDVALHGTRLAVLYCGSDADGTFAVVDAAALLPPEVEP